jgi:hypothetical protein
VKLSGNLTPTAEAGAAFRPAEGRRSAPVRSSLMKRSLSLRTGREVFMLGQVLLVCMLAKGCVIPSLSYLVHHSNRRSSAACFGSASRICTSKASS